MKNRRWITLALVLVLVIGLMAAGFAAGAYGGTMDLDGDNKRTIHDAQLAKEAEDGLRKLNDTQLFAKSDYRSEEIVGKLHGEEAEDRLNILLIGNSFSCGFPEELAGLLDAVDIKARIYSVYYPGCSTKQHWDWTSDETPHYRLRHYLQTGGYVTDGYEENAVIKDAVDLEYCLAAEEEWDVIALQQHFTPTRVTSYENALAETETYAANMFAYLKEKHPEAKLVWYETWAYSSVKDSTADEAGLADLAEKDRMQTIIHDVSTKIATDNNVGMIPCGGAWDIARTDYELGDMMRDTLHSGWANGGQYLNACVWFETLTGLSCIDNPYRPADYVLDDTNGRIATLQTIAHRAVAENPITTAPVV